MSKSRSSLLERAQAAGLVVLEVAPRRYRVASLEPGHGAYELILNRSGRIACSCPAGVFGGDCCHATALRARLEKREL